jgi:UDP-glucuronate 4-epimerase
MVNSGFRVVGIDNFDAFYNRGLKQRNLAELQSAAFEFVEADIRDRQAMSSLMSRHQPQAVFHLAALAGVRPSIADPARYVSVNVDGLASVLDAARGAQCSTVLFASSSSVYGNNRKVPFAETDPVDEPISPYAATKRAGELICHTYSHLFGIRIGCLRFFTVYGPAQRPDLAISSFMRLISDGREVPMYGDGTTSRDYTYIDDIVAGIMAAHDYLAQAPPSFCRIWNLGGSSPVALRELIESIGRVVGRTPRIRQFPMQPGDVDRTWADLTRSAAELGYEPRMPFDEGLQRQWAWMQRMQLAMSPVA